MGEEGFYIDVIEMATALMVLSGAETYNEKMRYLMQLYDFDNDQFMGSGELIQLLMTVLTFFEHSGFVSVHIEKEEIESIIYRMFFTEGIDPQQGMTIYEAKQWLKGVLSRSRALCDLLGCTWENAELSTFQRQQTMPVHQFETGMLTITDLKYHLGRSALQYCVNLSSDNKMTMHERALAKGADDPLKFDYSRFLPSKKGKTLSKVVVLNHGHLMALSEWRRVETHRAATFVQSIFRGIKGRKKAEMKARIHAFINAKQAALQRVRDKVRAEVLTKENMTGLEKLKYDAKIRNRAAKLKAEGLPSERDDVLATLIAEGIVNGEREVSLRFAEIAKEKGLEEYMDEDEKKGLLVAEKDDAVVIAGTIKEEVKGMDVWDIQSSESLSTETISLYVDLPGVAGDDDAELRYKRKDALWKGARPEDLWLTGESFKETVLRFRMMMSEYSREDLYTRLRALDNCLTLMKTQELMLEVPSKRLLIMLVNNTPKSELPRQLAEHFRIVRSSEVLAGVLRDVAASDLEFGLMRNATKEMYVKVHAILEHCLNEEIQKGLKRAIDTVTKAGKSAAMGTMSMMERTLAFKDIQLGLQKKKEEAINTLNTTLEKVNKKLMSARLAHAEVTRRCRDYERLQSKLQGDLLDEASPEEDGCNWYGRYAAALQWPEDTKDAVRNKYMEISNVSKEFIHKASLVSMTIINEMFLPAHRRTIKPVMETACDGRAKEGGRGTGGVRYKYEAWNIRFKVMQDDHGIFNGSDEFAAKAAGSERRNSMEALKLYLKNIGIPLVTTVDYNGFRVLAVAKMPLEVIRYDESGDVRGRREEMIFGTRNRGDTFVDSEKKFSGILEQMSKQLNLSRHAIKAFKDVNSKWIWSSGELRGFKGEENHFHLINFWRIMPPEWPAVDHLVRAPRDMSIFWRFLRPEFVTKYHEPLSADANCLLTNGSGDWEKQLKGNEEATSKLFKETIPAFAEYLCKQPITSPAWQGYGLDITTNLHRYGINARHLGLLRGMFWRKLATPCSIVFNSKSLPTQSDSRLEVDRGAQVKVRGVYNRISTSPKDPFTSKQMPVDKKIMENSANNVEIWAGEVSDDRNSAEIRLLLLAEIVARTTKNVIRSYQRILLKLMKSAAEYMQVATILEFLNILTGSHPNTTEFWGEHLYQNMRMRYGKHSVTLVERPKLRQIMEPMVIYMVQRLQDMLGFKITRDCIGMFHKTPRCFRFTASDIVTPIIRVKHNIPLAHFADALLLNMQADTVSSKTYSSYIMEDRPLLYWKMCERKGSKIAFNHGTMGNLINGFYSLGVLFESPGPIVNEEVNRGVRLLAQDKTKIDCKFAREIAPEKDEQRFTVEIWARVTGLWDIHRVLFMNGRYCLSASRENKWVFQVFAKYVQVALVGPPIDREGWSHIVCTYDGKLVRMYINASFVGSLELREELNKQLEALKATRKEGYDKINREERQAQVNFFL